MSDNWAWTLIVIPLLVAFFTAYITHYFTIKKIKIELSQEYKKKFNTARWDIYLEFVNIVSVLVHNDRNIEMKKFNDKRIIEDYSVKLLKIEQSILLMGSIQLVDEFGRWKTYNHVNGSSDPTTIDSLTRVINFMRSDLGEEMTLDRHQILNIIHPGWQRSL